jgi:hypothetical protein
MIGAEEKRAGATAGRRSLIAEVWKLAGAGWAVARTTWSANNGIMWSAVRQVRLREI